MNVYAESEEVAAQIEKKFKIVTSKKLLISGCSRSFSVSAYCL